MEAIIVIAIVFIILWVFSKQDKKPKSKNYYQPSLTQNVFIPKSNIEKTETSEDLFSKYVKLAKMELDEKNFEKAIFYYNKAIEINSYESFCFYSRAHCKSQIKEFSGAIEDYSIAIKINSNKSLYYAMRGITYWKWGKIQEAIKDWEVAASLGSEDASKWLSLIKKPLKIKYKNNWENFRAIVNKNNITCLYHFTDRENIPSIIRYGGLYSWYTCEQKSIEIPKPGGNQLARYLDLRHNLQDYVRLSFNKRQPMLYVAQRDGRINNPVFLEISPEVIYWEETLFSDKNATANSVVIGCGLDDFKRINFRFAKSGQWQNEKEKGLIQAEVLVKSHIPLSFIKNIEKS